MEKLRIIYTPETDEFRLNDIEMIGSRNPGNPRVLELRNNYAKLREFIQLPSNIGVVTYEQWLKRNSRLMLEEIDNHSSTYMPLDIFEQVLNLRNQDIEDPINREYTYRALGRMVSHPSISLDYSLAYRKEVLLSPNISSFDYLKKLLHESIKNIEGKKVSQGVLDILKEALKISEKFPDFSDLEKIKEEISLKFIKNKVSRDFPLYYLPPRYNPELFIVSLNEGIEVPEYYDPILRLIRLGCEASGSREIPSNIEKEMNSWKKDKIGGTAKANSLDELLGFLSEPRTLLTDLYVVDNYPELAEIGFESFEFRL